MSRFVPNGFMDTERTLIHLARAAHPERWDFDQILEAERSIWLGLGKVRNSEFIEAYLRVDVPDEEKVGTYDRLCDYGDALEDLRLALYAGEIKGEFIDEFGKTGFIFSDGWGGDAGFEILMKGTAWLDEGENVVCRLILFQKSSIERLATKGMENPEDALLSEQRPKIAASKIQKSFDDWRARQPKVPTYREDVEYMRGLGVGRDEVRKLRAKAETNPRGAPKKKIGG